MIGIYVDTTALRALPAEERDVLGATVAAALAGMTEARSWESADVVQVFRTSDPTAFAGAQTVVALTGLERAIYTELYVPGEAGARALEREIAVIAGAAAVAVPSEVARHDVIGRAGRLPADVTAIGAPVLRTGRWRGPRRAVVVPGAVTPHRNAEGAIAAYAALPTDLQRSHRLVLGAGRRTRQHLRLRRIARSAGVSVVTTAATIPGCLRHASVALFPTFWDGYSPGAAEARSRGVPIAASTTSAAAEIVVDPELLFDPRDAPSLGRALLRALARDDVRPAPEPPADAGAALRAIWERAVAGRELQQRPNLLPSVSDRTA